MSFSPIIRLGNPLLRAQCYPIDLGKITSENTQALIQTLFDHMAHYQGVGIAAPQIGVLKQIFVYGFEFNERYANEGPIAKTVMINPKIIERSQESQNLYEGCLSLRGLRGSVPRAKKIIVEGWDQTGAHFRREVEGFEARIIQHEMDHLNGLTFIDRIQDLTTFGFSEELEKHGMLGE